MVVNSLRLPDLSGLRLRSRPGTQRSLREPRGRTRSGKSNAVRHTLLHDEVPVQRAHLYRCGSALFREWCSPADRLQVSTAGISVAGQVWRRR